MVGEPRSLESSITRPDSASSTTARLAQAQQSLMSRPPRATADDGLRLSAQSMHQFPGTAIIASGFGESSQKEQRAREPCRYCCDAKVGIPKGTQSCGKCVAGCILALTAKDIVYTGDC